MGNTPTGGDWVNYVNAGLKVDECSTEMTPVSQVSVLHLT